jgi:hypothetical protein
MQALKNYLSKFDKAFAGKNISGCAVFLMIVMKWMMQEGKATGRRISLMNLKNAADMILRNELPAFVCN